MCVWIVSRVVESGGMVVVLSLWHNVFERLVPLQLLYLEVYVGDASTKA